MKGEWLDVIPLKDEKCDRGEYPFYIGMRGYGDNKGKLYTPDDTFFENFVIMPVFKNGSKQLPVLSLNMCNGEVSVTIRTKHGIPVVGYARCLEGFMYQVHKEGKFVWSHFAPKQWLFRLFYGGNWMLSKVENGVRHIRKRYLHWGV